MSEIDERMRDWRTDRIAEYARLENEINIEKNELITDPTRDSLLMEQTAINKRIKQIESIYRQNIEAAQQQQTGIKLELVDTWGNTEDKTFECPAGIATLRTTKSLHIRDKVKLINFLELNKKLTDFIKSFEITKLRKIKDAGMLEDEICTWDEKKSVAIKITGADQ